MNVKSDELDRLADAARSGVNKLGEQALWKAVLNLDAWFFVGQGHGDDAEPLVAALQGRPMLLAFTDEDRALAFARHRAETRGGTIAPVLSMDIPDAVQYGRTLASHGVHGVLFNDGEHAFQIGFIALADLAHRYRTS